MPSQRLTALSLQLCHPRVCAAVIVAAALGVLFAGALAGGESHLTGFRRMKMMDLDSAHFAGAVLVGGDKTARHVVAWGNEVMSIRFPGGKSQRISESRGFGQAGCLLDANGDGEQDLVLFEKGEPGKTGRMVWIELPAGTLHVIDTEADFTECLATDIDGKRGVMLIHRQIQVRFYEIPADPTGKWTYREIYSIYTPSAQGGLLRHDVNDDGFPDIFGGNYWFQAPGKSEKPWHIFAINKWWEKPRSAMLKLTLVEKGLSEPPGFPSLLAAEAEADPARVALFEKPPDAKQLWREAPVEAIPAIRKPEAIATGDLNADGLTDLVIGENAGDGSRLLVYWGIPGGKYQGTRVDWTGGLIGIWPYDYDGDGRLDLIGLGPSTFYVWRNTSLKQKPEN